MSWLYAKQTACLTCPQKGCCALSLTHFHALLSCMTSFLNQDPVSSITVCSPHLVHCNPIPRSTAGVWGSHHIITDRAWTSDLSTAR